MFFFKQIFWIPLNLSHMVVPVGCFFAIAATFRECTTDTKINNNHTASFNSMSKNMEYTRMTVSVGHNLSILCYCWKRRFQSKTHTTVWGTTTNPLSNTGCSKIQILVVSMENNILYITEYSILLGEYIVEFRHIIWILNT